MTIILGCHDYVLLQLFDRKHWRGSTTRRKHVNGKNRATKKSIQFSGLGPVLTFTNSTLIQGEGLANRGCYSALKLHVIVDHASSLRLRHHHQSHQSMKSSPFSAHHIKKCSFDQFCVFTHHALQPKDLSTLDCRL